MVWKNSLIQEGEGKVVGTLSSGINITERKKAEDALRKNEERLIIYASELETKVQDRTEELALTVEKLRLSNNDLEREIEVRIQAEKEVLKALAAEVTGSNPVSPSACTARNISPARNDFPAG